MKALFPGRGVALVGGLPLDSRDFGCIFGLEVPNDGVLSETLCLKAIESKKPTLEIMAM